MNEIIDLVEDFVKKEEDLYKASFSEIIKLSDLFQGEISKLDFPFHLNIIDELRANENAHSRILAKILAYKRDDNYPFLQSFLDRIEVDREITTPEITVEKYRIDILICDTDFALIIENKVNYAADQPGQLKKYYDTVTKNYHHKREQIFLLYLTRWGRRKPSDDTLPQEDRDSLGTNYKEVNFQDYIL
ncbi:MAG: PD-(D/E)XK nuclease family protein [Ekhidna sp.]|nr:PD-(D/E)XK nuclease family protein [Ekhidna sp.]